MKIKKETGNEELREKRMCEGCAEDGGKVVEGEVGSKGEGKSKVLTDAMRQQSDAISRYLKDGRTRMVNALIDYGVHVNHKKTDLELAELCFEEFGIDYPEGV